MKNNEIIKWVQKINKFRKKYKMDFFQYEKKLGKNIDLSWAHEKDYIEWDWALSNLKLRKTV